MADGFVRSGLLRPDWTNNINTGLAGWWALREGCGVKASDISGEGNTGTLTSGPLWSGGGLKFDGTNDYVNAGTMGAFGSQIKNSAFFCVFRKTGTAIAALTGTFNTGAVTGFSVEVNEDQTGANVAGKFRGFLRDTAGNQLVFANTTAVSPNDGEWHTLTIIFGVTATTGAIIYDGQSLPLTHNNTGTVGASANFGFPLTLGARNNRATIDLFSPGSIATARLWNRTLKIEEALRLHQNPNIGLWVPDTARYRATPAAGGADVRSHIIPAYMRIAA